MLGLAAVVATLCVAAAGLALWGPGPKAVNGVSTEVILDRGAGLGAIARRLRAAGVIRSTWAFAGAAELGGVAGRLKAGDYEFRSGATLVDVLNAIRDGAVVRRVVTIPEGVTSAVATGIVQRNPYLTGRAPLPKEGAILPETYEIRRGETRAAVIERMSAARDALLATLWRTRAGGLPFATPEEAVTMASIVEKETAAPSERARIAAVFINHLKMGMRLETDPAVIYGLTGGAALGHGLRLSELATRTPYNTYLLAGLPPTPIANPGAASLAATLRPAAGDDLYFVADGSGGHVFADTYEAHLKNVARWRAIERARNTGNGG
ncbi:MAG: endolytic transglycosylase MltG [Caulobacteraceae bacterium]